MGAVFLGLKFIWLYSNDVWVRIVVEDVYNWEEGDDQGWKVQVLGKKTFSFWTNLTLKLSTFLTTRLLILNYWYQ